MVGVLLWLILFVLCWPLALALLVLYPIIFLITLPLRIVGFTLGSIFDLLGAIISLPSRVMRRF